MLSDSPIRIVYEGDGSTKVWPLPVGRIDNTSDIRVVIADEYGTETNLQTGYAVDLVARTLTYPLAGDPLPTGSRLAILREVPYRQDVDGRRRLSDLVTLETQLDLIVMQTQQLAEAVSRAVKIGVTDTTISVDDVLSFLRNAEVRLEEVSAELAGAKAEMIATREDALVSIETGRDGALADIGAAQDTALTDIGKAQNTAVITLTDLRNATVAVMTELKDAAASSEVAAAESAASAKSSQEAAASSETSASESENAAALSESYAGQYAVAAAESAAHAYAAAALAWDPSVVYVFPQTVAGSDGHTYRCTGTSQMGVPPSEDDANWTRLTAVTEGFFELDPEDGDENTLMPSLVPGYSNEWTLDVDGDIMPRS